VGICAAHGVHQRHDAAESRAPFRNIPAVSLHAAGWWMHAAGWWVYSANTLLPMVRQPLTKVTGPARLGSGSGIRLQHSKMHS